MTVHVFIGVGPANLHRALKIQKIDPHAKLVFIDNRLQPETRDINRERARANIFRFSSAAVKDKLIAAGIREEDLLPLIHERDFDVNQGFQFGDGTFFGGDGRFTQIQIRDLQLLFMSTMDRIGGEHDNQPILIKKTVDVSAESFSNKIAGILDEQGISPEEMQSLKIHVATGALTGEAEKNEIIYPDKAHYQMLGASDDVEAMPVVPVHGTTTFVITGKIALDQLKDDQRSLDLTQWEGPLKAFGWNLIRPPRIRVFYANDILYIGTEIPIQMNSIMNKEEFERQVTEYTRTIARLVFPNLDIDRLSVNLFLRSRFPTDRGEMGDVLKNTIGQELHSAHNDTTVTSNVTVLTHGDSRYLPHYQTGSGFVTAFHQNELYAEIYSRNTFAELVAWAIREKDLPATTNARELEKTYKDKTGQNAKLALEAFQQELFMAFSRDIIDHNKERVGKYFNAIHTQALNALGNKLDELLIRYNHYHGTALHRDQFPGIKPSLVAMELLHSNNQGFLREVLPQLLNKDFTTLKDKDILHVRDMHLLDFDKNLGMEAEQRTLGKRTTSQIIHSAVTKVKLELAVGKLETLLENFNRIHKTKYKTDGFNQTAKKILIMEMLNRNGSNIEFLRNVLPSLIDRDVSELSDKHVLQYRDEFTQNYPKLIDSDAIVSEFSRSNNLTDLVKNLSGAQGKQFNKVATALKLPLITKERDAEELRKNLLNSAMKLVPVDNNDFVKNMKSLLREEPEQLTINLKKISASLKNNQTLHQRALWSIFTGKHSSTINKFAKDIDSILAKYDKEPEQLKVEALCTLMKFHHHLEQGHSRRTLQALMHEMSEAVSPSISKPN